MSIGLGFIFGPAIGGVLGHYQSSITIIASGVLTLLLLVYAGIILKEPERRGEANKRQYFRKAERHYGNTEFAIYSCFLSR